jgi:hypothetical protein
MVVGRRALAQRQPCGRTTGQRWRWHQDRGGGRSSDRCRRRGCRRFCRLERVAIAIALTITITSHCAEHREPPGATTTTTTTTTHAATNDDE